MCWGEGHSGVRGDAALILARPSSAKQAPVPATGRLCLAASRQAGLEPRFRDTEAAGQVTESHHRPDGRLRRLRLPLTHPLTLKCHERDPTSELPVAPHGLALGRLRPSHPL